LLFNILLEVVMALALCGIIFGVRVWEIIASALRFAATQRYWREVNTVCGALSTKSMKPVQDFT